VTTAPAETNSYMLPLPGPDTAVVLPRWISPGNTHPNARYREPVWPLAPLIDNPSTELEALHWKNCPAPLLAQMKLTTWTMINGQLRPTFVKRRGVSARTRGSATEIVENAREWMRLARWLNAHGITDLADCTGPQWRAYAAHRWGTGSMSQESAKRVCYRLTDLWAFDQLSARPAGISRPPWDIEGDDDFVPAVDDPSRQENSREPIDPRVLGPLLVWATLFVEEFADDILTAWAEKGRLTDKVDATQATPEGIAAVAKLLLPRVSSGAPLPSNTTKPPGALATTYIAALTGATRPQVSKFGSRHGLTKVVVQRPGPCPLHVPVTGRINGLPWREHIDFYEAAELMRHLGTAALILCLYLTGMRQQEAQAMRSGCCPDPEPEDQAAPRRHLIRSRHFKNVINDDGHPVSAGEEREIPWVAITPVVRAIRVLERMVAPDELLLSATRHDFQHQRPLHGALKKSTLNKRIEDFVVWANHEAEAHGMPGHVIPPDSHGAIRMSRFRRTLAWHIARRPGGLIALAIQYGHMRTVLDARTSSGYGSRSRRGIHSVLDVETALASADTAARLRDRVAAGEKISGPAARRALTAAAQTPRFEGRIVPKTFARKAADFLAQDGVVLFDNPDAFLICAFKRDTALCEPDPGATAPRQYDCRPGCGNTVRTDTHARLLRERADEIDKLAAHAPGPISKRLRTNAGQLRDMADTHDAAAHSGEVLT
jgi:hypothetical protein